MLPFLAYTQRFSHTVPDSISICSLTACLPFHINITVTNLEPSTSQFCVQICDTVTNMKNFIRVHSEKNSE